VIVPGEWLGLMGGGQLGRMFCQAAQSLGYRVAVLDPAPEGPAASVADMHIQAEYDDEEGLLRLTRQCRAVTTEFENVPATSLKILAKHCRVTPGAQGWRSHLMRQYVAQLTCKQPVRACFPGF
jgi:5-(carboxyamino)imidazole ribonucleotide synthase